VWDICYRNLSDHDLRADVTAAVKSEFDRLNVERQLKAVARSKGGGGKEDDEEVQATKKVTTRIVADVIQALRSLAKLSDAIDEQTWLDGRHRPNCVILENCVLDLDAFVGRQDDWCIDHTPQWFSKVRLPYAIDKTCQDCASPKWDAFLDRVMKDDEEGRETLQQWAGYCLTRDTSFQKFLMLEGEGSNGKSVYCAALTALLGRQNVSNVSLERFGDRFSLSATLGKLANIATECSEMDDAAEGILKAFTSGDPMEFERKHKDPFSAIPTARFLMSANNRPRFKDGSGGLWRRMLVVKFDQTIREDERVLGMDNPQWWERSGELPAIFWWAVLGLHRLRSRCRFTESQKSQEAVQEYREETNPARAFLTQTCEEAEQAQTVFCSTLYGAYCKWAKANGYHAMGERRFGKEVKRVFKESVRRRVWAKGDRPWYYTGITLHEQSDNPGELQF
jgi:P4 family phage/plasmid primase-like protien